MLYLVGTPIGNMKDISLRAIEILSSVSLIACEDTRTTGLLLRGLGIEAKLMSYHEHNKAMRGESLIRMLSEGADVALVSDAGMPCISDPGYDLVKLCIENDIDVTVVPGPVAAITALVMSGLDTRRYHYEGFLASEGKERKIRLAALKDVRVTIVLYEAPHRLLKTIDDLVEAGFGDCEVAFCRELTKRYEQVIRTKVCDARALFEEVAPKGEFVICLEPLPEPELEKLGEDKLDEMIRAYKNQGMSTKEIVSKLADSTDMNKKELYTYIAHML